jgi:hypothetical protein
MAKHTQAHMSRKVDQNQSAFFREQTKRQMEYYMGAKLIEIGVNPQSAIYRWSEENQGNQKVLTYSAYWGDSKERILEQEQNP